MIDPLAVERIAIALFGNPTDRKEHALIFREDKSLKVNLRNGRVLDFGGDGKIPRLGIFTIAEREKGLPWMRAVLDETKPSVREAPRASRSMETSKRKEASVNAQMNLNPDSAEAQARLEQAARRWRFLDRLARDRRVKDAVRTALVLIGYVNHETGDAFVGQERLARDLGIDSRSVRNHLDLVVEHGYFHRTERHGPGHANLHRPLWGGAEDAAPKDKRLPTGGGGVEINAAAQPAAPRKKRAEVTPESEDFDRWYEAYPRKKERSYAWKCYGAVVRAGKATPAELLEGAIRYAREKEGSRYIKYPATWLNKGCWKDEPEATAGVRTDVGPMSAVRGIFGSDRES